MCWHIIHLKAFWYPSLAAAVKTTCRGRLKHRCLVKWTSPQHMVASWGGESGPVASLSIHVWDPGAGGVGGWWHFFFCIYMTFTWFNSWLRRPGLPPVRISSHHTDSVDDSTKPSLTLWRHDCRLTTARTCLTVFLVVLHRPRWSFQV